jgi:hypothetical protein
MGRNPTTVLIVEAAYVFTTNARLAAKFVVEAVCVSTEGRRANA